MDHVPVLIWSIYIQCGSWKTEDFSMEKKSLSPQSSVIAQFWG